MGFRAPNMVQTLILVGVSGVVTLHFQLIFTFHLQEGATATVHTTNTSCGQGAPGRLGGTRSVRQATTNEHVEQAWRGWADDKFREQCPTDAKLLQQHMYIYIYIY